MQGRLTSELLILIDCYESLLFHATGPMKWNIGMRKIAISKNFMLNEYGLFDRVTKNHITSDEKEIMKILIGKYVEPCEREFYKF